MSAAALAHTPGDLNFLQPDPGADWKTLRTPHFNIHHEAKQQEFAQQLATIAEGVHARLSPWLRWQPKEATEVIILDSVDYSNGAATVLPYNRFYLYLPAPVEGEIMDHNPWLEMVFTHEYVHILHLDMAHGGPGQLRELFGRPLDFLTISIFPQLFAPSWVIEGLAIMGETRDGYGRLDNALYEAMMRMEVQRGLRSLTEVSFEGYSGSRWPFGLNYLYGAYFYRFMVERYGPWAADFFVQSYSYNVIPWRMDNRIQRTFNKSPEEIWAEFQAHLRQRFAPQLATLQQQAQPSRVLYATPYRNEWLTPDAAGGLLFYHDDGASEARVLRLAADGSVRTVLKGSGIQHLDYHPAAGLLLSKYAVCGNVKLYADLYRWDEARQTLRRLTTCGRYPRAAWRPDGAAIAAVQQDGARTRLMLLDAEGKPLATLAELPLGDVLGHLAWSPDGTRLTASVKRQRSGWNLEEFDLSRHAWQPLTRNPDREIRPRYSADGRAVLFLSDHDGVWNLRRLDLLSGEVETLSHTLSAVLEAVEMPDGSLRLAEYGTQGMTISALPHAQAHGPRYAAIDPHLPPVKTLINAPGYRPAAYAADDYSPWSSLHPRSWLPMLYTSADGSNALGVQLYGADTLGFHQWQAVPLYYWNQHGLGGAAAYTFYNKVTLAADRQYYSSGAPGYLYRYLAEDTRYRLLLHHAFNSKERSVTLGAGVALEDLEATFVNYGNQRLRVQDTLSGIFLRYDDTEFYARAISPEDGRRIRMQAESYDLFGQNDRYSGRAWRAEWREYLGLGASHVLYLRALHAGGDSGIRRYLLGGELDMLALPGDAAELGRRSFPLRGYPEGTLSGNQLELFSAEWRIPLGLVYDGLFVPPLGLGRHALTLFAERGAAWYQGEASDFRNSLGAEWNAEMLTGYDNLHLGVKLGYAQGLDRDGAARFYLQLGSTF